MSSRSKDRVRFLVCHDPFTNCPTELFSIFRYLEHVRCYDPFSCRLKSFAGLQIRSLELLCSPWRNDGLSTVPFLPDCEYLGLDHRHGGTSSSASFDNPSYVSINQEELPKLKHLLIPREEEWLGSLNGLIPLILGTRPTLKRLVIPGSYTAKIPCLSTMFPAVEDVTIVDSRFASISGEFREVRRLSLQKWRHTLNDPEMDHKLGGTSMPNLSSLSIETDLLDERRKVEGSHSEFWEKHSEGLTQLNIRHDERNMALILGPKLVAALKTTPNLETSASQAPTILILRDGIPSWKPTMH